MAQRGGNLLFRPETVMIAGIDIEAGRWRAQVNAAAIPRNQTDKCVEASA